MTTEEVSPLSRREVGKLTVYESLIDLINRGGMDGQENPVATLHAFLLLLKLLRLPDRPDDTVVSERQKVLRAAWDGAVRRATAAASTRAS